MPGPTEYITPKEPTRMAGSSQAAPGGHGPPGADLQDDTEKSRKQANVKSWTAKIKKAKSKWEKDFKRMKENMEFAFGLQRIGQKHLHEDEYVTNIVLRSVNQKVASLYARDPKAIARHRERLYYELWDGKNETLQFAVSKVEQSMQMGMPVPGVTEAQAVIQDFMNGTKLEEMVRRVGRTLEIVYQWQIDQQEPEFKLQMKNLVRRAITCGVAYVRENFIRDYEPSVTTSATERGMQERVKRAKAILQKMDEGEVDESSRELETLRMLVNSLNYTQQVGENNTVQERLEFDFPPATSVIVDPRCRSLKGFVGAHWIAQEYIMPVSEVNEFFEVDVKTGGELVEYGEDGEELAKPQPGAGIKDDEVPKPKCCVWEVFDITTRSRFFIVDGWKDYIREPEPLQPITNRFWPIFALTFNDIECEPGLKISVYPPSDVDLMWHAQRERNRVREELRIHRIANTPIWLIPKGVVSEDDKLSLTGAEPHQLIEVNGIAPGQKIADLVQRGPNVPIDPALYETQSIMEDVLLSVGAQEANLGPPSKNVTATGSTIAEQSRLSVTTSNVDDLDDLLSDLARSGGEMLMREMGKATVIRIAGPGAVWSEFNREDFLNEIYLEVVAASSGRPNKAIEVANFERLAPLLLQAGANPQFLVREGIKRLDDRLDPKEAFPLLPPQLGKIGGPTPSPNAQPPGTLPPPQGRPPEAGPQQPLQQLGSEQPVPLPAA